MSQFREVVPSASRLMGSLRDIGYDLGSAVADVVDNSVDAGAESVSIELVHAGAASWLRVSDDGVGMTERQLDEAMRYGSSRDYGGQDLGRFGLGLKTASLSQCRSLTVASRTSARGRVAIRKWDLDGVAEADAWLLERLTLRSAPAAAVEPLSQGMGTVVLWQKLDRVEGFARPSSAWAGAALERDAAMLREHLGMVFHRFIEGSASGNALQLTVNGVQVDAWDPFSRAEDRTECLSPQHLEYQRERKQSASVTVNPYILPSKLEYSTPTAHEAASGPKRWNRQQGLYIYRCDRMIQSGGWNRLRTMDEHSKLARVAVDIPEHAEVDWRLNVSKMSVLIPEALRPALRALVGTVASRAQERYRETGASTTEGSAPVVEFGSQLTGFRLADHWIAITHVLEKELASDPEMLDRVLERLINSSEVRNGSTCSDDGETSAAV